MCTRRSSRNCCIRDDPRQFYFWSFFRIETSLKRTKHRRIIGKQRWRSQADKNIPNGSLEAEPVRSELGRADNARWSHSQGESSSAASVMRKQQTGDREGIGPERVSALKWLIIKLNVNKTDSSAALISERSANLFLLYVERVTSLITRYTTGLRVNLRNLQSPGDSCSMCVEQSHSASTGPCAQHKIFQLSYNVHKMQNVVQPETATFTLNYAITKTGLFYNRSSHVCFSSALYLSEQDPWVRG